MGKTLFSRHRHNPHVVVLAESLRFQLERATEALRSAEAKVVRQEGLSLPQYYVLLALHRAAPAALPCKRISEHMPTRDSDVTRLLDRLEARGLVTRARLATNRRVVKSELTAEALAVLARLEGPLVRARDLQVSALEESQLQQFLDLLALIGPPPAQANIRRGGGGTDF